MVAKTLKIKAVQRTIPLEVDTFKNESVAFGGIFVCQRIQRSQNFNY